MCASPLAEPSGELLAILQAHVFPHLTLPELQSLSAASRACRTALSDLVLSQLRATARQRLPGLKPLLQTSQHAALSDILCSQSAALRHLLDGRCYIERSLVNQHRLSLSPGGQLLATAQEPTPDSQVLVKLWQLDSSGIQLRHTLQPVIDLQLPFLAPSG